ncbi:MAG: NINE protein [Phaeodactylibacter sp.]|nr:NINE protein [Phaeodactylibacter sp.]
MKDKNVAGILALFLGGLGMHRFYLGQIGLGIVYCLLIGTGISFLLGLIDAISFFVMDKEVFDHKYNGRYTGQDRMDYDRRRDVDFDRRRQRAREYRQDRREDYRRPRYQQDRPSDRYRDRERQRVREEEAERERQRSRRAPKANPHKQEGIQKYKDYDYKGAIVAFEKALEVDPQDVAVHFNLACAYSLEENANRAFYHLDRAVAYGFKDFDKIREHDALAFLRIQEDFDAFEGNNFRLSEQAPSSPNAPVVETQVETTAPSENLLDSQPDLLDQIKKLGELREKGLLTEEEFAEQKRKLLG